MRKVLKLCLCLIGLVIPTLFIAQSDTIWIEKPTLELSGFLDIFYIYDFNKPTSVNRQPFFYNHNRHNEFNINLGLIKLGLTHAKYRSNLVIQTGTYANDNYASEPGLLKNIYEANIGIALNQSNSLWLDAGILPSHIGFGSAISMDNLNLTRSIAAESSPYFLTGAKLIFLPSDRLELALLVVNGWQRIQRVQGNSTMSVGTQVNYNLSKHTLLNWSTFIGTDDPDQIRRYRYFNNLFCKTQLTDKLGFVIGFDIGHQQKHKGSKEYNTWFSPTILGQYKLNDTWKLGFRAEYYQDRDQVIVSTRLNKGLSTTGFSINTDYVPLPEIMWRVEARYLASQDKVLISGDGIRKDDFFLGTSIAIKFAEKLTR